MPKDKIYLDDHISTFNKKNSIYVEDLETDMYKLVIVQVDNNIRFYLWSRESLDKKSRFVGIQAAEFSKRSIGSMIAKLDYIIKFFKQERLGIPDSGVYSINSKAEVGKPNKTLNMVIRDDRDHYIYMYFNKIATGAIPIHLSQLFDLKESLSKYHKDGNLEEFVL